MVGVVVLLLLVLPLRASAGAWSATKRHLQSRHVMRRQLQTASLQNGGLPSSYCFSHAFLMVTSLQLAQICMLSSMEGRCSPPKPSRHSYIHSFQSNQSNQSSSSSSAKDGSSPRSSLSRCAASFSSPGKK